MTALYTCLLILQAISLAVEWTNPTGAGIFNIVFVQALSLGVEWTDISETTMINLVALFTFQGALDGLAQAIWKAMRRKGILVRRPHKLLVSFGIRAVILPTSLALVSDIESPYWHQLVPVGYIILAVAAVIGLDGLSWEDRRTRLQVLIWTVAFASFDTMLWGLCSTLAKHLALPAWCVRRLLFLVVLCRLESNGWKMLFLGVGGIVTAMEVSRRMTQDFSIPTAQLQLNHSSVLVRRVDKATMNSWTPPLIATVVGALVACVIWYIGPRNIQQQGHFLLSSPNAARLHLPRVSLPHLQVPQFLLRWFNRGRLHRVRLNRPRAWPRLVWTQPDTYAVPPTAIPLATLPPLPQFPPLMEDDGPA